MSQANQRLHVVDEKSISREIDLVSEVFHHINKIIPESQELQKIGPKTTVREAMALMEKHGCSQLPVVNGETVIGVFSYRSFARMAAETTLEDVQRHKCAPGDLTVDEYLEQFVLARFRDDIMAAFNALEQKNGLLVGDPKKRLNILTRIDLIKYLNQITRPFVMLSEIERVLRKMIQRAVTEEELVVCADLALKRLYREGKVPTNLEETLERIIQGAVPVEELVLFADETLKNLYREGKVPTSLEKMSFNDYISIISSKENWPKFEPLFGSTRGRVAGKLEDIREVRNALFHFKREVTGEDIKTLTEFRDWLIAKAQQADVLSAGGGS